MAVNEMRAIFAVATVIFFILGLWPLALITLVALIAVTLAKLLEEKKLKRVLVVATGALLNPIILQQKETIPCIAHAVALCAAD